MTIEKCDCGRWNCEFFDSGEGERGRSYTRAGLEQMLHELKEKVTEIEEILSV